MEKKSNFRVRFAPSPTGNLHIGGMRTALFNWLFARHNGGTFLLRVEDTDKERSQKKYTDAQLEALKWCGIESDEPLVFQSERTNAYQKVLQTLLASNKAYRCTCSSEEIEKRVRATGSKDEYFGYDGFCRNKALAADCGKSFVIRFAVPDSVSEIVVQDLIRGTVTFARSQFDDFIIARSDGSPTYNFVVVVDDNFQNITHIIRGEEHLGNTPKQILLAKACGFIAPQFAHIPLILSPNGGKLSKRDSSVDLLKYKKEGYLPAALVNYMVRLGWAHGNQELFTTDELIKYFSLEAVGKKGAVFDIQKLQWVNAQYIKALSPQACKAWLKTAIDSYLLEKLCEWSDDTFCKMIALYQERVKTGLELYDQLMLVYDGPLKYKKEDLKKWVTPETKDYLDALLSKLELVGEFSHEEIAKLIKEFCKKKHIKLVSIAQPLRIALTGGASSPGVFELLSLVGQEESISRIESLQQFLESY